MRRVFIAAVVGMVLVVGAGTGRAASVTVSGYFNDAANPALAASDGYLDLRAARFGDDDEIARNVALYELTVTTAGLLSFDSAGWAAGGAEPYFTLFEGSGVMATFLDSNYFDPNIDFSLTRALPAGTYMLALGVWMNMSFAENNPDAVPSLGDGFTALGDPTRLGTYYYELAVSSDDGIFEDPVPSGDLRNTPAPEPSGLLLMAVGALGVLARRR